MYDIYLTKSCTALPDFTRMALPLAALLTPDVQQRIVSRENVLSGPGFLGLNLSANDAKVLLELLKSERALGQILPAAYRTPTITQQQAMAIASQAIERIQTQKFSTYTVSPVRLFCSRPATWTFSAGVKELQEQGMIPGAIIVDIDKVDGHVWGNEEYKELPR